MRVNLKPIVLLVIPLFSAILLGVVFTVVGSDESVASAAPASGARDIAGVRPAAPTSPDETNVLNPDPPTDTVKLVFIHHSCGNNWLDDGNGNLGANMGDNNYYISDTYYDWGPDNIGSYTDIGHWWSWFRGEDSITYTNALYTTTNQHATYTRPMTDPGGENEIVMFKSCYPNSNLMGNPDDPPTTEDNPLRGQAASSSYHTVGNAKGIYNDILEYFQTRQDKLFVVITAPPVLDDTYADNARAFNNWLVNDWLTDYPHHNVAVFDFYDVLTTNGGDYNSNDYGLPTGNHHRVVTTTIPITVEHITDGDDDGSPNTLEYPTGGSNNHPSPAGNQKATGEFVPLLNVYYNCWKHGDCEEGAADWISVTAVGSTSIVYPDETATYTLSVAASEDFTAPVTLTLQGAPLEATVSLHPNPVIPPGNSQLYVTTTASTAVGIYSMTVTGTAGVVTDTVGLILIVASVAPPSFTLSISPEARVAMPNQAVSYTAVVTGIGGFSQPVTLTVAGLPAGVDAAWSVNPVQPGNASVLTLSVPSSPPFGDYLLQIVGTAHTQVVTENVGLTIDYPARIYLPVVLRSSTTGCWDLSGSDKDTLL
jgi:hypothetical protein